MRCDQPMGLCKEAEDFLQKNAEKEGYDPCPHCGENTKETLLKKQIGSYPGMFDVEYPLYRYEIPGGYAEEFLQCSPWSSGPMMFLGLIVVEGDNKREILWSNKKITDLGG